MLNRKAVARLQDGGGAARARGGGGGRATPGTQVTTPTICHEPQVMTPESLRCLIRFF